MSNHSLHNRVIELKENNSQDTSRSEVNDSFQPGWLKCVEEEWVSFVGNENIDMKKDVDQGRHSFFCYRNRGRNA
jgi:hypothetical protein